MYRKISKKIKLPPAVRKFENKERIVLRDFLALERTTLANERTLFAYIRTSLYLTVAGFAFLEIKRFEKLEWMAYFLFSISVFLVILGATKYILLRAKLRKYYLEKENNS